MNIIKNQLEGNIQIEADSILNGIIIGNVNVLRDVVFIVHWIINWSIHTDINSEVEIHGIINWDIYNLGKLKIFWIVNGKINKLWWEVILEKSAIVNNS